MMVNYWKLLSSSVGIMTFPIYGKINVPNHQAVMDCVYFIWILCVYYERWNIGVCNAKSPKLAFKLLKDPTKSKWCNFQRATFDSRRVGIIIFSINLSNIQSMGVDWFDRYYNCTGQVKSGSLDVPIPLYIWWREGYRIKLPNNISWVVPWWVDRDSPNGLWYSLVN